MISLTDFAALVDIIDDFIFICGQEKRNVRKSGICIVQLKRHLISTFDIFSVVKYQENGGCRNVVMVVVTYNL